jgi:hypothetical protein
MPKFMILLRESDDAWAKLTAEDKQTIMQRYFAWSAELRSGDHMRGGEPLLRGGRVLRTTSGEIVEGPYTETKEVVTGYFMIEAATLDEAARLARGCPALTHGESVLVRQVAELEDVEKE